VESPIDSKTVPISSGRNDHQTGHQTKTFKTESKKSYRTLD
jgi:hypothetical protein